MSPFAIPQGISLHISANDEEVVIVLNRKTFVSLLINMTEPTGVIVGVITHRVSATNPAHKSAHFAVNQGTKNQMIVVGHQLIAVQLNLMNLQTLVQNSLKRGKIGVFAKNIGSQIATVEGMIKSASFVRSGCSRHG
jgi:hypothetical protein